MILLYLRLERRVGMKRTILFINIFCGSSILSGLEQNQMCIKKNIQLYNAVLQENYKRVKELLRLGANRNERFNGLLLVELTQNEDIMQLLLLYKHADKNGIVTNENKKGNRSGNI